MGLYLFAARGEDGKRLSRALLAYSLRQAFGLDSLPETARDGRGKPYFPAWPALYFNVSHSGPFAFCGLGSSPLGVDIEQMRPCRRGLARRIMSDGEYEAYLSCADKEGRLFALWTLKESYCKCTGEGLAVPLRQSEFQFRGGEILSSRAGYGFRSYGGATWRAAACVLGADPPKEMTWVTGLSESARPPANDKGE